MFCFITIIILFLHYGQEPGLSVFNLARNYEHARKPSDSRGLSIWTVEVKLFVGTSIVRMSDRFCRVG